MDWLKEKLNIVKKYKYVVLVIIIGIFLMLLPESKTETQPNTIIQNAEEDDVAQELQRILQMVNGAGRVEVYLKKERSEQYIYQTDIDSNTAADRTDENISTILITDNSRNQTGLIKTILSPKYSGAVIVCQGAEDPKVKLSIVDAVSKATGLGTDKISVLKMK